MHEYHHFVDFVRESKILEYGIAFVFMGAFAALYVLLHRPEAKKAKAAAAARPAAPVRLPGMKLPEGYGFHQGHTWVRAVNANTARLGIDDFANKLVGKIDRFELPAVGATVKQGEPIWKILAGGKAIDMLSPIDGQVEAVNDAAAAALPGDPYDKGWLVQISSSAVGKAMNNLLRGELAKAWSEQAAGSLAGRGGTPAGAKAAGGRLAKAVDADRWEEIAKEYFLTK